MLGLLLFRCANYTSEYFRPHSRIQPHSSQLSTTTYITCLTTFIVSYAAAQVLTTVTSDYRMLEDPQYSEVVRWGDQGDNFVVHPPSVLFGVRYVRP